MQSISAERERTERSAATRRILRRGGFALLILLSARAPQADEWNRLGMACETRLRGVREARVRQDPQEILAAETAYAAVLLEAADHAIHQEPNGSASPAAERVWLHLLADRHSASLDELFARWSDWAGHFDPHGLARFSVGLAAYESERFVLATELCAGPGPAHLRAYCDYLHLRALEEAADPRAGGVALALARGGPEHQFHDAFALRAARHLLKTGEYETLTRLVNDWIADLPAESGLAAAGHTLLAEAARQQGQRRAFLNAFRAARGWRALPAQEAQLRLEQARELIHANRRLSVEDLRACCGSLIRDGGAREALRVWEQHGKRLTKDDRSALALQLIERLYDVRQHSEARAVARELAGAESNASEPRMWLIMGRIARREGKQDELISAYRAAAALGGQGGSAAVAQTALWELARELEDARAWPLAAESFGTLAADYPDGEYANRAHLRGALCRYRAGDLAGALAQLEEQCATASERFRGGPCLWRALLGPVQERAGYLRAAGSELRPGYHALRAAAGLQNAAAGDFWGALSAEVRTREAWAHPATGGCLSAEETERILALCQDNPLAEAGWIFMAFGYQTWARGLWEHLPGRRALDASELAALCRALGDFPRAIRHGGRTDALIARYPVAFAGELSAAAGADGFSPAFLLAVMRQESLLSPVAHSRAGAIGLMQLMPGTARRLADSLGMGSFELERPAENVRLGSAHLAELWTAYDGALPMVLAAYNAGKPHAERWLAGMARDDADWDAYIEQITFAETRSFVKSVLMHYWSIRTAHPNP